MIEPTAPFPAFDDATADNATTIETTLLVFDYARRQIARHVRPEHFARAMTQVKWCDHPHGVLVHYRDEQAGSLFFFRRCADHGYVFSFPALGHALRTARLADIDAPLREAFLIRAAQAAAQDEAAAA